MIHKMSTFNYLFITMLEMKTFLISLVFILTLACVNCQFGVWKFEACPTPNPVLIDLDKVISHLII